MECRECGSNKIENRSEMLCATCNRLWRKTRQVTPSEPAPPMKKRSDIMTKMMAIYRPKAAKFLVGKMCAVYPDQKAVEVHHMYTRSIDDLQMSGRSITTCLICSTKGFGFLCQRMVIRRSQTILHGPGNKDFLSSAWQTQYSEGHE